MCRAVAAEDVDPPSRLRNHPRRRWRGKLAAEVECTAGDVLHGIPRTRKVLAEQVVGKPAEHLIRKLVWTLRRVILDSVRNKPLQESALRGLVVGREQCAPCELLVRSAKVDVAVYNESEAPGVVR